MKAKIIITIMLFILFAVPVSAEGIDLAPIKEKTAPGAIQKSKVLMDEDRIEQMQQNAAERLAERCANIEDNVDAKLTKFEEHKDSHVDKYNKVHDKLISIVAKLEDKGFDTSKLEEDVETFDEKVKEYAEAYVEFIDALEASKEFVCGESEGAFKNALITAREEHSEARTLRASIREFYQTVIREDIKELRQQAAEMVSNSESSN